MPSHHHALKKVLEGIRARISSDEVQLLNAATDEERAKLIDEIADLNVRQKEIRDTLVGDDR